jgi:uncharacterized protein YndB with AHSA1/START domain
MTTQDHVDTSGQLDAVERSMTVTENGEMFSTVIRLSQTYSASVDDLWDACTTRERLAQWFAPVTGELQLGGRYQIEGNAEGTIQTCEPPQRFSATWDFGGETSQVTVRIDSTGAERARLTLEHAADVDRGYWCEYGPGAGGVGWDLAFLGLAHHLATGSTRPVETTDWAGTDDARQFIAGSSRRWADLSIRAGTPESDARAAEAQTTSVFLGDPQVDESGAGT